MEKKIVQSVHKKVLYVDKITDFVEKCLKLMSFKKSITEVIYKVMNI